MSLQTSKDSLIKGLNGFDSYIKIEKSSNEPTWLKSKQWSLTAGFLLLLTRLPVFSIWKSLRVLQKARIKFVARAIYTYLSFSYTYTLLFCWKIKSCCDRCFRQQIRPLLNDIHYETMSHSQKIATFRFDKYVKSVKNNGPKTGKKHF